MPSQQSCLRLRPGPPDHHRQPHRQRRMLLRQLPQGRRPDAGDARAPQVLGPQGQTHFVMQRKDRVRIDAGHSRLHAWRLSSTAGSRRVVAGCAIRRSSWSSAVAIG